MKILFKLVITLFLIVSLANTASANDRGLNGLIIGGGAGAIMGQAVGRNVESTIIGATVGGIIGAAIGSNSSHRYSERVIIHGSPRGPHGRYFNHSPRNYSPRTHNRPRYKGHNYQRETIIVYKQHRGKKKGHYKNRRHQNRKYHSPNRYKRPFKDSNRW